MHLIFLLGNPYLNNQCPLFLFVRTGEWEGLASQKVPLLPDAGRISLHSFYTFPSLRQTEAVHNILTNIVLVNMKLWVHIESSYVFFFHIRSNERVGGFNFLFFFSLCSWLCIFHRDVVNIIIRAETVTGVVLSSFCMTLSNPFFQSFFKVQTFL